MAVEHFNVMVDLGPILMHISLMVLIDIAIDGKYIFLYHHANACQHNKSLNIDHCKNLLNCAYAFI